MRTDLPTGTVTFMFTDVEGSTRLLHEVGEEAYATALAEHRRVIRNACRKWNGVEVDTQGDAFFFAFPTVPGALAAAAEVTEVLTSSAIRVRVGLHTGTPLITSEGYVGEDVHRAARIAASGHGGQVLLSAATAALARQSHSQSEALQVVDLGDHRLKDLPSPERVYQLGSKKFPTLKSLFRTSLPAPASPFLGRERELAEVVAILTRDGTRLLSLTGPGGTGKTRLALAAAAQAAEDFAGGTTWVGLAPVHEPGMMLPTIAQALEIKEKAGERLDKTVGAALAGKRALIVLDNLEQLLPAAAKDIAKLASVAGPVLLLTSRERLQIQGEVIYPVPTLTEADAVSLFVTRARSLQPTFSPDRAVTELCRRLDNLPLALELAAARTVVFSPVQLLERLSKRLDLFKGGRDADPRQRTLRATIGWSYDLLEPPEQQLFGRLSVFAGGCSYEAAEQVCGADPDTLQALIDKSLLRRRDSDLGTRFSMLETIREFASETLSPSVRRAVRDAHLAFFAESVYSQSRATRDYEPEAWAFLRAEQGNLFEALSWALETGAAEPAQKILLGAWFYWMFHLAAEGDNWAARIAALPSESTRMFAGAVNIAGEFPRQRGDPQRAVALKEQALRVLEEMQQGGEPDLAGEVATVLTDLSDVCAQLGDIQGAAENAARALEIRRTLGERSGIAHALIGVGSVAARRGALDDAARFLAESVEIYEAIGLPFEAVAGLLELSLIRRAQGDASGATAALDEARHRALASGDRFYVAIALAGFGLVAADEGRAADAVGLLSRALTEVRDLGLVFSWIGGTHIGDEIERVLQRCRRDLGANEFQMAYEAGVGAAAGTGSLRS
ncbi:MAG: tetratricopeptide repeat protein [Chloroflexota bacterium]|nr:tetratricopeptide repeat protein [Chloroflexota bacterium]